MRRYQIRVELDQRFDADDVRLDLRTNKLHPLHDHDLQIAASPCGAVLGLTLTAADLWSALLTTMALVRHCGYVPNAVEASAMGGVCKLLTDLRKQSRSQCRCWNHLLGRLSCAVRLSCRTR
jgi:hypothetical protein